MTNSTPFIGRCSNKWKNLKPLVRPTQFDIGYAWVQRKLKNFQSKHDAAESVEESGDIPAVLFNSTFYITDSHHTLAALDFSGFDSVSVVFNVLCDYSYLGSNEDAFWDKMVLTGQVWLPTRSAARETSNELPVLGSVSDLPTRFSFTKKNSVFKNDDWRSFAGLSRKVKNDDLCDGKHGEGSGYKYCGRCFIRHCDAAGAGVPYIERVLWCVCTTRKAA